MFALRAAAENTSRVRAPAPVGSACRAEGRRNQSVIDRNLGIIHFPSGDGLGCPSSDGKYRDDSHRLTDHLTTRSVTSQGSTPTGWTSPSARPELAEHRAGTSMGTTTTASATSPPTARTTTIASPVRSRRSGGAGDRLRDEAVVGRRRAARSRRRQSACLRLGGVGAEALARGHARSRGTACASRGASARVIGVRALAAIIGLGGLVVPDALHWRIDRAVAGLCLVTGGR